MTAVLCYAGKFWLKTEFSPQAPPTVGRLPGELANPISLINVPNRN
jgi:hypothetical protein